MLHRTYSDLSEHEHFFATEQSNYKRWYLYLVADFRRYTKIAENAQKYFPVKNFKCKNFENFNEVYFRDKNQIIET